MPRRAASQIARCLGLLAAAAAIAGVSAAIADNEPTFTIRNGVLEGWEVTRDDEVLLCRDPVVFIRARQIECE
jgi:hypothetical protein